MTNRKCGTCRFFEVSTLQTHGWCRNAAYPRRDELALLRETELGCRSGWAKDYWEARAGGAAVGGVPVTPEVPAERVAAMPVGAGLAPLVPAEAAATDGATGAPPRRRVGYQAPGVSAPAPAGQDQDVVVGVGARLGSHPELGENGVPLPRARRSAVAEAHKRALERREAERALSAERRTALGAQRTVAPPAAEQIDRATPSREGAAEPLTLAPPAVPAAPRAVPEIRETRPFLSGPPVPAPPVHAEVSAEAVRSAFTRAGQESSATAETLPVVPGVPPTERPTVPGVTGEPRYWDQPGAGGRFTRMRPAAQQEASEPGRVAQPIGRARPESPGDRPTRTIRPLGDTQPVERPAGEGAPRVQFPRSGRTGGTALGGSNGAQPARAGQEAPLRQVDPALLEQLEVEWRAQALQAEAGKRCGSCRYYRPGEGGERGTCGCPLAQTYRQPVTTQDLGCLSPLGTWWAATDEGWLQKVEPRGPRRATPLLDALERELAEHAAQARNGTERRRSAR